MQSSPLSRRSVLQLSAVALGAIGVPTSLADEKKIGTSNGKPTDFQIACMTLPYHHFPLERALQGIKAAGYRYVAWGTTHQETSAEKGTPVLAEDAPPAKAAALGQRCRDLGLEPLMMFSGIYPEHTNSVDRFRRRIAQAEAAGIPQLLTFGHTRGDNRKLWVERFKQLGPIARDHGILIVVKQHGETGQVTGEIVREVDDPGVRVNYDAGNVMDYTRGKVNPLEDIATCAKLIHSFCMKDHRMFPVDQDCAPGFGEIDHYRLLANVAFLERAMPLCCENISIPARRPVAADEIDANARRTREYLEFVVAALHAK